MNVLYEKVEDGMSLAARTRTIAVAVAVALVAVVGTTTGPSSAIGNPTGASGAPLADFNGDGYADLAVGVFAESVNGADRAGAVNVLYGSSAGLQTSGIGGPPDDQFWTQDSPGVLDQAEHADGFGASVEPGDFNADGFADLAIGPRAEGINGSGAAGAVNVLYGSANGLQADGIGGPDDQFWHEDSPGVKGDAEPGDHCGSSLASGDFDGDGYDDLATGCDFKVVNGDQRAGGTLVLYGSAVGLQAGGPDGPDDQFWTQDSPNVKDQSESGDRFGREVTSIDFNADGFDDLAISAVFEKVGTVNHAGTLSVLYGSENGLQATGTGAPDDQFWHQDSPGIRDVAENDDRFGAAVTSGDFNGDGYGDLGAGVRHEDIGSIVDAGAVSIIYGSAVGLQPGGPDGRDDQFISQNSPGVNDQSEEGDWLGYSMSAADYDGDGYTDLCAGARKEDVGAVVDAGSVNVLYGSAAGLTAEGNQFWTQDSPDVPDQSETGDEMAVWSAGGDFTGDGFADLTVAVWLEDVGAIVDAGGVNVFYSSGAGGLSADGSQYWDQSSPGIAGDGPETGDEFGWVVGAT